MKFIYFINLDDFLVTLNFGKTGMISSPSIANLFTYKSLHPIYNLDIDELMKNPHSYSGFSSPRMSNIAITSMSKNGFRLQYGIKNPKPISEAQIIKSELIANIEIEFEKIRREISPNSPSRLIAIYLAEDSYEGRTMLKNMFNKKNNFKIAPVKITCNLLFHKADSKWITEYEKTGNKIAIKKYWQGIPFDKNPEFEYLLEGTIELKNEIDKSELKNKYGS
ncbi:uncharacterized protein DUF2441 [Gillisia mitskevichiae]|uniref:Uncharacterized protein DUF2441 n=1 Tax=Gillisia mitskevichiae TaxID=270921 RepID=A0A495P1K4_9FLAO|nr:DUF2441 domain-containing protein [Gillisia mitskevichiae]RKS42539.1 uncharacterized protein DUF2441 [Gillisia mitskevichiae]